MSRVISVLLAVAILTTAYPALAQTGDGSIRANNVSGDLRLHTGDGSVTVERAQGTLDLDTGDGGVNVTGKLTGVGTATEFTRHG